MRVLTFAITYVLVNVATDLVYGLIDPRIRLKRRSALTRCGCGEIFRSGSAARWSRF